jgi:hypothetical protein
MTKPRPAFIHDAEPIGYEVCARGEWWDAYLLDVNDIPPLILLASGRNRRRVERTANSKVRGMHAEWEQRQDPANAHRVIIFGRSLEWQ